jgi:hypothetical protein
VSNATAVSAVCAKVTPSALERRSPLVENGVATRRPGWIGKRGIEQKLLVTMDAVGDDDDGIAAVAPSSTGSAPSCEIRHRCRSPAAAGSSRATPTAAATECPIEAHMPPHRKASRPITGRLAAEQTPRKYPEW